MTASSQRKFGIILQYIQMGLNTIILLVFTPIMLKVLGSNEYGIYNLASSIIAYLSLLSLGFGASYLRFYNLKKKENDDSVGGLNSLYLIVFLLMGFVALVLGLFLSLNVEIFYNSTYTEHEIDIARILTLILAINLSISFPASLFVSYITSQERFIFLKLVNMGKTIIGPLVNIVLLYMGYGSIGMVVSTTVLSVLIDCINVCFCIKKLHMPFSSKNIEWKLIRSIAVFSVFIAMNQIVDQINWQTDKIILGKMINGTAVAIYALGATINTMFVQSSTAISNVFAPRVNVIVAKNEPDMNKQLTNLFIKVGRMQWFVLVLILLGFVFFGKYFIYKWAGDGYEKAYYVALLLMAPATIPLIQNLGIEIQTAKNMHQFRSVIYLVMAIANVGISIWFCSMWGEIGTALGTTIALLVANGIIMNIYYQKKLDINIISFWKSIASTIPSLLIPTFLGLGLMILYSFQGLVDFCLMIIGFAVIYSLSVYFIGLNIDEKHAIKSFLRGLFNRRGNNIG